MPGDVGSSRICREKSDETGDFVSLSEATERNGSGDLGHHVFAEFVCDHFGGDESRADGVDRDLASGEFFGVRHGESADASLRGGVVGLSRIPEESDDRGHVDDASFSLLGHEFKGSLRAVEYSGKVEIDDLLPLRRFHAHDEAVFGNAGVVDQDVAGAELLDRFFEHGVDLFDLRDVGFHRNSVRSVGLDGFHDFEGRTLGSGVIDNHVASRLAEFQGDGGPDAARRSRDDGGRTVCRHGHRRTRHRHLQRARAASEQNKGCHRYRDHGSTTTTNRRSRSITVI